MKVSAAVALVGLALALVDVTGTSRYAEGLLTSLVYKVRGVMASIGVYLWYARWVALGIAVVGFYGAVLLSAAGANNEWIQFADRWQLFFFHMFILLYVIAFAFLGLLMLLWGIFWALSLPKRGVVSVLGVGVALAAVVLEFIH